MRPAALIAALVAGVAALAWAQTRDARRSGYEFMSAETQAMQRDDTANPGMLWVLEGGDLWRQRTGAAGRSCADCHGDDATSMRGVATRYPAFDRTRRTPIDLAGRIVDCRSERQQAPAPARESRELLALTAFVAHQSRGMPVTTGEDPLSRAGARRGAGALPRTARPAGASPAPAAMTTMPGRGSRAP